jgi:hypothetical protein
MKKKIKVRKKKNTAVIKREIDDGFVYKLADAIESKSILNELQQRMFDKMGYQIEYTKDVYNPETKKKEPKEFIIEDLTAKAYFEIAKREEVAKKTRYDFGQPIRSEDDKTVTIMISVTDNKSGKIEWGTSTEPKLDKWGNLDKFAGQKALTKAQRNAVKDLLNYEVVQKCFAAWLLKKQIIVAKVEGNRLFIEEGEEGIAEEIKKEVDPPKQKTMADNQKEVAEKAFYA